MVHLNLTINFKDLNTIIKGQELLDWFKKQDSSIGCLQETQFKYIDTNRLKVRGWKRIYHANTNLKKTEWLY